MKGKPSNGNLPEPRTGFRQWLWKRPNRWYLLGIPIGGILMFVFGIVFSAGVVGPALNFSETLQFCGSTCHEMSIPLEQLKHSVHYSNEFGVRAICSDCHVPPGLVPRIMRHLQATGELWAHITGVVDTPAKFEQHKLALAQKVWKELKANNSATCRRCHSFEAMALDKQGHSAAKHHSAEYIAKSGKTCIDCHKGVAHDLPKDM